MLLLEGKSDCTLGYGPVITLQRQILPQSASTFKSGQALNNTSFDFSTNAACTQIVGRLEFIDFATYYLTKHWGKKRLERNKSVAHSSAWLGDFKTSFFSSLGSLWSCLTMLSNASGTPIGVKTIHICNICYHISKIEYMWVKYLKVCEST